jgi:radical SAM superfamily enzyme YgiQ (UPF0313 family)
VMPTVPNLGSCIIMPRSGLITMAAILKARSDYDVTLLFEPYVGAIDAERLAAQRPRFVLLNGLTTTAVENELLVQRLRERAREPILVIAGGEHATMYPDQTCRYADVVVLFEGEGTLLPLLAALEESDLAARDRRLAAITGIWFRDSEGEWHSNNTAHRLERIDYRYDFSVFAGSRNVRSRLPLTQLPVQASRGCTYYCSFCSWTSLFGKAGYFTRPAADFVHDVEHAFDYTGVERFMVVDNLFGADQAYTADLLEQILRRFEGRPRKPTFTVLCRADQFAHGEHVLPDEFLELMRRAGVWQVSMGLESVDDTTLEDMRKEATTDVYLGAAERLHRFGFEIAASFVAGYANDSRETVLNIAPFASRLGCFTIQLYCQAITPRTRDWKRLLYRRIPGCPDRFFNGHTVTTFPNCMLPSTLQRTLFETADLFFAAREPQKRIVGRIYRKVWNGLRDYHAALERIECEVLLPEGIYVERSPGLHALADDRLRELFADRERYTDLARRIEERFDALRYPAGVAAPRPLPRDPLPGAGTWPAASPPQPWAAARQLARR